jgi:16S rRNA (uracil1498-N3)-methyltransferase
MRRFFISNAVSSSFSGQGTIFTLDGSDAHHIARVLRMKEGDRVLVCDMAQHQYICHIRTVKTTPGGESIVLEVAEKKEEQTELSYQIVLFQALIKGDKMDSVIRHAVELGVHEVVPVLCERCVSTPDEKNLKKKIERWQRVAIEAAKQSGRSSIPKVSDCISFRDMIVRLEAMSASFICFEGENKRSIREVIGCDAEKIGFFIGPEGGLSCGEVFLAQNAGIPTVTLGKLILRTETAALAVLSMVLYEKIL